MADTHINAFFADVDEAEKKVLEAHAEWEEAKRRLEDKKRSVGFEGPTTPPEEPETADEPVKPPEKTRSGNSLFGKK